MRKQLKGLVALGLIACLSVSSSMTALAETFSFTPKADVIGTFYFIGLTMSYNLFGVDETASITISDDAGIYDEINISWSSYLDNDGNGYESLASCKETIQNSKTFPILPPEILERDKSNGSLYSKIYQVTYCIGSDELFRHPSEYYHYYFKVQSGDSNIISEGWKQDSVGWYWLNTDGSYPKNEWKEINGKYYYFGSDGYMLHDTTTPDGYTVNENGEWIMETGSSNKQSKYYDDNGKANVERIAAGILAGDPAAHEAAQDADVGGGGGNFDWS